MVVGDLASVVADAVVRPANQKLEPMTPALRRLDQAAGPRFVEQYRAQQEFGIGAAVVTAAGDLRAELVIHAVIATDAVPVSPESVRRAAAAALWQAAQWHIETLALPAIGADEGQLPPEAAAEALVPALTEHLRTAAYPATVLIVVGTDRERDIFGALVGRGGLS